MKTIKRLRTNKILVKNKMYARSTPQDPQFVKLCLQKPKEFSCVFDVDTLIEPDREIDDTLILSAAAFCDNGIDHLLDGYSWALLARISRSKFGLVVNLKCKLVPADEKLRQKEKHTITRKFGLFSGVLPWWRKIFTLGRLPELLLTGMEVERQTAHQPIFYRKLNQAYFCSAYTYPAFDITWPADQPNIFEVNVSTSIPKICSRKTEAFIPSHFPKFYYTCMHPLLDPDSKELLTYSFLNHKFVRKTDVNFYAFGEDGISAPVVKYIIPDRAALHMFGFTKRYFILFANSLVLNSEFGTLSMICGSPILRTIDDDFCGDLIIHFVPRSLELGLKPFSVNTKLQGYVYHTINCFDLDDGIVVDAFVSKLNPSRESSQFELGNNRSVFDNEGDPYRFYICNDTSLPGKEMSKAKILTVQLDSSIDFHCVNPGYLGRSYENWWMITHQRYRDAEENITKVTSKLTRISIPVSSDPLKYDPETSMFSSRVSDSWGDPETTREYLRTPLFVPYKYGKSEDDGVLFCWSYFSSTENNIIESQLLMISPDLTVVKRIQIPGNHTIPYSVHCGVYTRHTEEESMY